MELYSYGTNPVLCKLEHSVTYNERLAVGKDKSLYTDTRYNDEIRSNDNLTVSLNLCLSGIN